MQHGRINALTGLRFCAAFSILFAHAFDWLFQFSDSDINRNFSFASIYGMPLFFVLSGFVIHYNYARLFSNHCYGTACWQFAVARFARIYPLFFFLLLFAVPADSLLSSAHYNIELIARILFRYATLTQTWKYTLYENRMLPNWLFSLSWSVSTEWFFYIAYALALFRISALRSARSAALALGVFVTLIAVASIWGANHRIVFIAASDNGLRTADDFNNSFYRWALYFSPYARLPEFILGCLTAQLFLVLPDKVSRLERRAGGIALAASVIFLAWGGWAYLGMGPAHPFVTNYTSFMSLNFGLAPAIAVLMFCTARYGSVISTFLSATPMVLLGERSYSIYLTQGWTLNIVNKLSPASLNGWTLLDAIIRVLLGVAATLVISAATYRLIELPFRKKIRAFGDGLAGRVDWIQLVSGQQKNQAFRCYLALLVGLIVLMIGGSLWAAKRMYAGIKPNCHVEDCYTEVDGRWVPFHGPQRTTGD